MSFLNSFTPKQPDAETALRHRPNDWPRSYDSVVFLGVAVRGLLLGLFTPQKYGELYSVEHSDPIANLIREGIERELAKVVAAGVVQCFLRDKQGGAFSKCSREFWNTEALRERFDDFDMDPKHPFKMLRPAGQKKYIWLDKKDLERLFASLIALRDTQNYPEPPQLFAAAVSELKPSAPIRRHSAKSAAVEAAILEIYPVGIPATNQKQLAIDDVLARAKEIFGGEINAKTVRRVYEKVFPRTAK